MSILKKKAQAKKYTKVITARIQEDLYDSFKNHCEENGFSINEAIKVLIENELKSIQTVYKNEEEIEGSGVGMFDLGSYVIDPHIQVPPLSRYDVDPLEMMSDDEWQSKLEELKRERGN
jgi:hypothetical protein